MYNTQRSAINILICVLCKMTWKAKLSIENNCTYAYQPEIVGGGSQIGTTELQQVLKRVHLPDVCG